MIKLPSELDPYIQVSNDVYFTRERRRETLSGKKGFFIDESASTRDVLTYVNPLKKEVVIGARGTDPTKLEDLGLDLLVGLANSVKYTYRYDELDNIVKRFVAKGYKVDVTGHSLGSILARDVLETNKEINKAVLFSEPASLRGKDKPIQQQTKEKIVRVRGKYDPIARRNVAANYELETYHGLPPQTTEEEDQQRTPLF